MPKKVPTVPTQMILRMEGRGSILCLMVTSYANYQITAARSVLDNVGK